MNKSTLSRVPYSTYAYALLFYIIMNLVAGYSITLFVDIKAAYAALTLPSWAPPTWVFGVAWTVNNILVLWGNIWSIYSPPSHARTRLLQLQAVSWVNYAVFQWLSFGTGIPLLYFLPTFSMFLLTLASMYYARRLDAANGTYIAYSFTTLFIWLCIASALGLSITLNN
jgi:tryptophan-rich sensory protein